MSDEKHAGGRPPKFDNVDELDKLIVEYFESLIKINDETGEEYTKCPTITGLTLHLGFCDKKSLYDYEKKDKFIHSIKRARLMVEQGYEEALLSKGSTGAIFALKNFGWKDKIEQDITTQGEKITNTIDYSKLDTETLLKIQQAKK